MRRTAFVGAAALLGLVALWLFAPSAPPAPASPEPQKSQRMVTVFAPETPQPETRRVPSVFASAFHTRHETLASACGLTVSTRCEGSTCVALTEAPDLDAITGWVSLATRSPAFVWSTAMRDLGMPNAATACGDALATVPFGALQVERDDGTEVWCALDDPDQSPGWEERARALCDAEGARLDARGFDDPDARLLRFD